METRLITGLSTNAGTGDNETEQTKVFVSHLSWAVNMYQGSSTFLRPQAPFNLDFDFNFDEKAGTCVTFS